MCTCCSTFKSGEIALCGIFGKSLPACNRQDTELSAEVSVTNSAPSTRKGRDGCKKGGKKGATERTKGGGKTAIRGKGAMKAMVLGGGARAREGEEGAGERLGHV